MKRHLEQRISLYATDSDFCRIFREDIQSLYLLSLVLTGDPEKAEQCFVAGLDDCASGNRVFKDWARSWARRVVIKNAIRSVGLGNAHDTSVADARPVHDARSLASVASLDLPAEIADVLSLPALERFAFVMSFCEGYANSDCALLLGCTRETLVSARVRALQHLKDSAMARSELRADDVVSLKNELRNSIDLTLSTRMATSA